MGTRESFLFYSDYYAFAAEAGLDRARAISQGFALPNLLDKTSVDIPQTVDETIADLGRTFDLAYEFLWSEAQSKNVLRSSFQALSAYVLEVESKDINTFLTDENIKVDKFYAKLANIFASESITTENIKT